MPACVLPNCNNPLLTIVGPVYVLPLLPEYVSVPGPVLVTPPGPLIGPISVSVEPLATEIVVVALNVMFVAVQELTADASSQMAPLAYVLFIVRFSLMTLTPLLMIN